MKLSQVEQTLSNLESVTFKTMSGQVVPEHFHITEVGHIQKHFIDCGGTERKESVISFQLWTSVDYDHRLSAQKLNQIIAISKEKLGLPDLEVEVEYQGDTIGKYGLAFDGEAFLLTSKQTDCLAKDNCGIPTEKPKVKLAEIASASSCAPGSGCC